MDLEKQKKPGFRSRRYEWYRRCRWWVSKQRAFEWVFLLFRNRYVTRRSDLVIEGYPRSGNTFARWAFITAQKNEPVLADHFHSIGHIRRALRLQVPVLVLIREPLDAVTSFLVYQQGNYSVSLALREYIEFYSEILRCEERVVIADFEEVTQCFGDVIRRVNRHFGTEFVPFDDTEENREKCFQIMESRRIARKDSPEGRAFEIPRPVNERERLKKEMRTELMKPDYADLVHRAQVLYKKVVE
jgi:hypothetical protein